jgi:uncharacterized protein YaaW (UPF0174 family)
MAASFVLVDTARIVLGPVVIYLALAEPAIIVLGPVVLVIVPA